MGVAASHAGEVAILLNNVTCDRLISLGDEDDGWEHDKKPVYKITEDELCYRDAVNRKVAQGVRVERVAGNHDEKLRDSRILGGSYGGIGVEDEVQIDFDDGTRGLFVHGDKYDFWDRLIGHAFHAAGAITGLSPLYYKLFKAQNDFWRDHPAAAERIDGILKTPVKLAGFFYQPLSVALRRMVAGAHYSAARDYRENPELIDRLERSIHADQELKDRQIDVLVTGHNHRPTVKRINGFLYCNSGDWVENLTALARTKSGIWAVLDFRQLMEDYELDTDLAPDPALRRMSLKQARAAQRLWPGYDRGRLLGKIGEAERQIRRDERLAGINRKVAGIFHSLADGPSREAVDQLKETLLEEFQRHVIKAEKHHRLIRKWQEAARNGVDPAKVGSKLTHHRERWQDHDRIGHKIDSVLRDGLSRPALALAGIFSAEADRLDAKILKNREKADTVRAALRPWRPESALSALTARTPDKPVALAA